MPGSSTPTPSSRARSLAISTRRYVSTGSRRERPHDARSDVEATVGVLAAQLHTYRNLPKTVDALHAWLYPSDPNRIDADGKLVWRDGVATVAFGAQAGTALTELADNDRSFLEWVLRKDFSPEVKAIIEAALEGRFPVRPPAESGSTAGG